MADFIDYMSAMGRGSDNDAVHVTRGEIVIPREVQDQEPAVVQAFIKAIQKLNEKNGTNKDWREFVVGSGKINPETGMEEFQYQDPALFNQYISSLASTYQPTSSYQPRTVTGTPSYIAGENLTPRQERAAIATFGAFGGRGQNDISIFQNIFRNSRRNELLPIEQTYLNQSQRGQDLLGMITNDRIDNRAPIFDFGL